MERNPDAISLDMTGCTTNLQIFPQGSSGSRVAMQGTHYGQLTPLPLAELRAIFAGPERDYGKYMDDIKVEHTCRVAKVIHRRSRPGYEYRNEILETLVFVQLIDPDSSEERWDVITIPRYKTNHQTFGYELNLTEIGKNISSGKILKKGAILATVNTIVDDEYCAGVNINTILVSHPMVIEDACVISESAAARMYTWGYTTKRMVIGSKEYPLYLYEDSDGNPAIFPEIGESVREDGILFGKREYDPILAAVEMTGINLTDPCGHFDKCTFVDPESEVVDIKVYRDDLKPKLYDELGNRKPNPKLSTPEGMQEFCDEYADGMSYFYQEIRDFYKSEINVGRYGDDKARSMTPRAKQVTRFAVADNPKAVDSNLTRFTKQLGVVKNDDYTIEITIRYKIPLTQSGKLTDTMGGKGILAEVRPDHLMPYDDHGVRVDLMMSDNAMLRRTNFNRGFEVYVNAARRGVEQDVRALMDDGKLDEAYKMLIDFTRCINPEWADAIEQTHTSDSKRRDLLDEVYDTNFRLWVPSDNLITMDDIERNVRDNFPPKATPLNIPMEDGSIERTKSNFTIGELYIIRLDKIGRENQALAAGKFQPFGTISKQHSTDKSSRPFNETAIKHTGESETRHQKAFIGGDVCADNHDRSNNPLVADNIIENILSAEVPTNIPHAVDRVKYPLGNNRIMAMNQHIIGCDGIAYTTEKEIK